MKELLDDSARGKGIWGQGSEQTDFPLDGKKMCNDSSYKLNGGFFVFLDLFQYILWIIGKNWFKSTRKDIRDKIFLDFSCFIY